MKILYLTRNFQNVQPQIAEALNGKPNVECTVLFYQFSYRNEHKRYPDYVHYFSCPYILSLEFSAIIAFVRIFLKCLKLCKHYQIDVIHANMTFFDGHIAELCARILKIKYLVTYRYTDVVHQRFFNNSFLKRSSERVLVNARAITFLSNTYRQHFLFQLPEQFKTIVSSKCCIVPNGINKYFLDNKYFHNDREDILNLIFIGKLSKRKNLETVIAAARYLSLSRNVKLTVIGELIDRDYLKIIDDNKFVSYHGVCTQQEILQLLRQSDILVNPSRAESFGLIYLEAMSQGVPVIYTRGQGFDELYKDGEVGYAVDCNNPMEIAEKIDSILDNYEQISSKCVNSVDAFTWEKITDLYVDLYK